ncbi:hypothetical protein PVAND_011484 [Polypedilum vanderplanki]|uniref:Uncharacterized protein n=1 Tax=Polypedilum vanderplanki TaxID=319348 RepID=A0A9J6CIR2_POLVA|nr:hypothetical protein PVAND_011484 [Polypedilum vanderplanki]
MVNLSIILIFGLVFCTTNSVVTKSGNYKALQLSGISNKIADLVTEAFTNGIKTNSKKKQDAVVIGESDQFLLNNDNNIFMNGFLKFLGFDSRKIGAVAMNGIIFIAQMASYIFCKEIFCK